MNPFSATLGDPHVRDKPWLNHRHMRVSEGKPFNSDRVFLIGCHSHIPSTSLSTCLQLHRIPDHPEWSERKVDPDTLSGLGCQTRSLHVSFAMLTHMNSVR